MSVSIQRYTLPANKESARIELDSSVFTPDLWEWKTISFVRNKPTWTEPKMYQNLEAHPNLASSLVLLKSPEWDHTLSLYPLSTLAANCNLIVDTHASKVYMNIRRCTPGVETEVYVVRGRTTGSGDARKVVEVAVDAARTLVGGHKDGSPSKFWDGLGVCTWESFGKETGRPTKDTLLTLVPEFPIKTFLIDDGWQDVSASRALKSFQEWDGMKAPMSEVVSSLKSKGIQEVGVWVTLQGYWISIDPSSKLIKEYDCQVYGTSRRDQPRGGVNVPLEAGEGEGEQWLPSPEKAGKFWMDWLSQMKSWGISFVKIDNQADYEMITGPGSLHIQQAMWSGMLEAVEKVWGSTDRVIMCMSHNERMLNGPGALGADRPKGDLVFRNSDDFNLHYDEQHPDFIQWNTYMSILTSQLSLVPDFDMFASSPEDSWPTYHAFLRALSPGPILVSDTPSVKTDRTIIDKLTSTTKNGEQRVVKPHTPAVALPGRWFWDNLQGPGDGPAMLAYVHVPSACGSMIGAWNCRSATTQCWAKDRLSRQDIEEALEVDQLDGEYALWSLGLADRSDQYRLVKPGDKVDFSIQMARSECEGVVVAKVWHLGGKKLAVLGMLDKFAPLAQIHISAETHEIVIRSPFSAGISVLVIDEQAALNVTLDGQNLEAQITSTEAPGCRLMTLTPRTGAGMNAADRTSKPKSNSEEYEYRLSVR